MDRVFLDAKVLFSAAYRADSGPVALWREPRTGALHLFTATSDANGQPRSQHYVAPNECPPPP